MHAIHLTAYGDPSDVLEHVEVSDPPPPGPGEVLVEVEFSPIIPSDFLLARGLYASRPTLPAVIGNEGVGVVRERGEGVSSVKVGDRVLLPQQTFAWAQRVVAPAQDLFVVPPGIDPRQASMLSINPPTAALLLSEYVDLRPGDWFAFNAGTSGVGRALAAFARARGLRSVGIVRREASLDDVPQDGDHVVLAQSTGLAGLVAEITGGAPIRLGLDGISGPSTGSLAEIVTRDATIVTYGAMSGEPTSVSPFDLISKRITHRGFFMYDPEVAQKLPEAIRQGAELVASGRLHVPVAATYPLAAIKDAIAHAARGGKVLLDMGASSTSAPPARRTVRPSRGTSAGSGHLSS